MNSSPLPSFSGCDRKNNDKIVGSYVGWCEMNRDFVQRIGRFWAALKSDPEALFELRQLVFAILIAAGVIYGLYSFQVMTKNRVRADYISNKKELTASLGDKLGAATATDQLRKLAATEADLVEKLGMLRFQEQFLREQYAVESGGETFAKVIFTLLPLSPVDIENGFVKMNVLDTRAYDYFDVNPINLQGDMDYSEFSYYLQYLEGRSEVGMIGKLVLEILPAKSFTDKVKVHFDMVLGRIQLRTLP